MTDEVWYPIGRSDDAVLRHVYQAKLHGRELAVWRADDGYLNVWENRCLHRGVKLSVGLNEGAELRCLYHGWRYASRTAGCTYIPAHPADAPAQTICNKTFPAVERYGLMWSCTTSDQPAQEPLIEGLSDSAFALRSLWFDAAPALVVDALQHYSVGAAEATVSTLGPLTLSISSQDDTVVLFVQPVDSGESVVHAVLASAPVEAKRLPAYRFHAAELGRIRRQVEAFAATLPRPEPLEPALDRAESGEQGVAMPRSRADAERRVVVKRKWLTAEGIMAFSLEALDDPLPTAQPGAHIDVQLPNGLVRQYSLTNRAGDQRQYVIGVKLEPESRGGSACLHEVVRAGDVLSISAPRNNFSLRRDALQTVLIAGGIGLTPLLSMAETLHAGSHPFRLHYFAQSGGHVAFASRLDELGDFVVTHLGLSPSQTGAEIEEILAGYRASSHLYVCGPGPMLNATRNIAEAAGWPEAAVHFEYFKNDQEVDQSGSFDVDLARSGLTLTVPAGESILEVLRANGIAMASSCEQGACGTCVIGVIEGDLVHQDVYLKPSERARGDRIATCVSRASSARIILDI